MYQDIETMKLNSSICAFFKNCSDRQEVLSLYEEDKKLLERHYIKRYNEESQKEEKRFLQKYGIKKGA